MEKIPAYFGFWEYLHTPEGEEWFFREVDAGKSAYGLVRAHGGNMSSVYRWILQDPARRDRYYAHRPAYLGTVGAPIQLRYTKRMARRAARAEAERRARLVPRLEDLL